MEADLGPLNIGLASAWNKGAIREDWRRIVDTAMLQRSTLWKKEDIKQKRVKGACLKLADLLFTFAQQSHLDVDRFVLHQQLLLSLLLLLIIIGLLT